MYNYSNQFKNAIANDFRTFKIDIKMFLIDGTEVDITESDIWAQSMSIESATSASGTFSVGSLIANKLTFSLNNLYDRFSEYDFINANLSMSLGAELPDGIVEMERYGMYVVTDASFTNNTITIVALDNLSKLSHDYVGGITFPATLSTIVRYCCNACGVAIDAGSIPSFMNTYKVNALPENSLLTYAGMISYAAQISGCFARSDHSGRLAFEWYPMNLLADKADGGTFKYDGLAEDGTPEAQLDGGNFKDYSSGDDYDGGTFRDLTGYHVINDIISAKIDTDDVLVTGVKVTSQPFNSETAPDTTMVGVEGYVYVIEGNPFVQDGQSSVVANQVFNSIGGLLFRPLSITTLPNPTIEAGDVGLVADYKNKYYPCFFSTVKFCPDAECAINCDAESANRQNASLQNALSKILQQSKIWVANEKTAREIAYEAMALQIATAPGFYETDKVEGGATIRYFHNKAKLEDSSIVWKLTAETMSVSTDGGKTWNAAIAANGDAIMNTIYAKGLNADWISTGTLSSIGIQGCEIISTDPKTNYKVVINDGIFYFYNENGNTCGVLTYQDTGSGTTHDNPVWVVPKGHYYAIGLLDNAGGITQNVRFYNEYASQGMKAEFNMLVNFINERPTYNGQALALLSEIKGSNFDPNGTYSNLTAGYLTHNGAKIVEISDQNNFRPTSSGVYTCGTQYSYWKNCWSVTFSNASDRRLKDDIEPLNEKYHAFSDALKKMPVRYHINGDNEAYETGFIAQEVKEALENVGLGASDFGGLKVGNDEDIDKGIYGLSYTSFIALLFNELRLQDEKIASLEDRLSKLEKEVLKNGN